MSISRPSALAISPSLPDTLRQRRQRLSQLIDFPILLESGQPPARNFPANTYPFRANSHFLYFAGLPLMQAAIRLDQGRLTLFFDEATPADSLWHGPSASLDEIAALIGADQVLPRAALTQQSGECLPMPMGKAESSLSEQELTLVKAMVTLRLVQDEGAIATLRQTAQVSIAAHQAGMAATPSATTEAQVRATMEQVILSHNLTCAYNSIVTTHGEVLHNHHYHHPLVPGDLLLADVGAEAQDGWATDITRTWPVSGKFSPTQRDLYEIVLAAHDACIAAARPGVEYRDLHLLAGQVLATGLVELGILKGDPESLVAQDAHALFFPHGVGHLLGLDVHDMEDLGDLAGYAPGRTRSPRFGLSFLRLDRPLAPHMVVTIEPGFYQVPGILNDPQRRDRYQAMVNWERLALFADTRGIRIEDDVLITDTGCEVLTRALATTTQEIEALVSQ